MIAHRLTKTMHTFDIAGELLDYGVIELDRRRTVQERWQVAYAEVTDDGTQASVKWDVKLWGYRLRKGGSLVTNAKLIPVTMADQERQMLAGRESEWVPSQAESLKVRLRQEASRL